MPQIRCTCGGDEFALEPSGWFRRKGYRTACNTYRLYCIQCSAGDAIKEHPPSYANSPETLGSSGNEPGNVVSTEGKIEVRIDGKKADLSDEKGATITAASDLKPGEFYTMTRR